MNDTETSGEQNIHILTSTVMLNICHANTVFDVRCCQHYQICGCPVKCLFHHSAQAALDDGCVMLTFLASEAEAVVVPLVVLPARDLALVSCTRSQPVCN